MSDGALSQRKIDCILAKAGDFSCNDADEFPDLENGYESFLKILRWDRKFLNSEFTQEYLRLKRKYENAVISQVKTLVSEETKTFTRRVLQLYKNPENNDVSPMGIHYSTGRYFICSL